jgi:DNA-binding CsgD family transcriptional regulator
MEADKPWKDEDTRKSQRHLPHPVDSTPWRSLAPSRSEDHLMSNLRVYATPIGDVQPRLAGAGGGFELDSTPTFLISDVGSNPVSIKRGEGGGEPDLRIAQDPSSELPPRLDGRHTDELLLEGFVRARRRFRGPIVAISDRTMITNAGASELMQPADRRLLWQWAQSPACAATGWEATFQLANGVSVQGQGQPVEFEGLLVGVVLHMLISPPASRNVASSRGTQGLDSGGMSFTTVPMVDTALLSGWSDLTDSERTVAEVVGRGFTNKQTGRRLFMSPHTVDYHLRRVYRKLGISSRVELARLLGEHYESLSDAAPQDDVA